jgi:hypothetical protein
MRFDVSTTRHAYSPSTIVDTHYPEALFMIIFYYPTWPDLVTTHGADEIDIMPVTLDVVLEIAPT